MDRRQVKAFVSQADNKGNDSELTTRKSVWRSPPSLQTLVTKVDHVEERLDQLESLISQHPDLAVKRRDQEELEQSRQELVGMRQQLDEAVQRLQQREADLHDTQHALENLTNQTALDREKIHALEVEKKELHKLVSELETKLNERVRKVGRLEKHVADMQRALNNTNNHLAALQQQMQEMQQQMKAFAAASPAATTAGGALMAGCPQAVGVTSSSQGGPGGGGGDQTPVRRATSTRHHTDTFGLPPIPLPAHSPGGGMSARGGGGVRFNFPPK